MKENGFTLAKARETIMDADYADDIALQASKPIQAEPLLYSLEKAAGGIGLHVNAEKQNICALIKIKKQTSLHNSEFLFLFLLLI